MDFFYKLSCTSFFCARKTKENHCDLCVYYLRDILFSLQALFTHLVFSQQKRKKDVGVYESKETATAEFRSKNPEYCQRLEHRAVGGCSHGDVLLYYYSKSEMSRDFEQNHRDLRTGRQKEESCQILFSLVCSPSHWLSGKRKSENVTIISTSRVTPNMFPIMSSASLHFLRLPVWT